MKKGLKFVIDKSKSLVNSRIAIWIVLGVLLVFTFVIWSVSAEYYEQRAANFFKSSTRTVMNDIEKRILVYEHTLRSGIGLYYASSEVSHDEWYRFVDTLQIRDYFPGIQGIGISLMLRPDQVSGVEQKMRREWFPDFTLKPAGKREQYSTIIYLEPLDKRNLQAIGYDMYSEPARRAAMEKARDTGLTTITSPVTLVQEIDSDVQAGILMYLPLYQRSLPVTTIEERRKALIGYVYSAFRMGDLMKPALDNDTLIDFELYDGEKRSAQTLLYRTPKLSKDHNPFFRKEVFNIGGRIWHIYFYGTKEFESLNQSEIPLILGIIGLQLSLLVFGVLISLSNGRRNLSKLVFLRTKELEAATLAAEEAAASKTMFLANMSHEIRTPMNAILGFVEQLSKNEKDTKRRKMFEIIQHASQSLLVIINDILDITKIESGKMLLDVHACDLRQLSEEVKLLFQQSIEAKKISYFVKIDPDVPTCVLLDETRVKQIVINILSNAVKFTQEGGSIHFNISFDKKAQQIKLDIIDNGIGVSKENFDKIFNSFEQEDSSTTRRFGGTGLGLAITKKLIRLMQGSIDIESSPGKGSTFQIRLAYEGCDGTSLQPAAEEKSAEVFTLEGKVLIVEDNKTNQMLICMILDEFGLKHDIANNGQEAVEMVSDHKDYDIILMDENMPVMSGIESVKQIRRIEKEEGRDEIPIIAVTANALSNDKERFLEAGMNGYLAKPYVESEIKEILSHYISQGRVRRG